MNELMKGKRGLVMGVANDHSIAWGIARRLADLEEERARLRARWEQEKGLIGGVKEARARQASPVR